MNVIIFLMIFFAAVCLLMIIVGFIDGNRFRVVKDNIEVSGLARPCRFVLISDLHNKVYGNKNDKIINAINKINPDFIVIAGDLVTSNKEEMTPGIELINELSKEYKVYYGLGNHESKIKHCKDRFGNKYELFKKEIDNPNIVLLENETAFIEEYNIAVTGLELDLKYFAHFKRRQMEDKYLEKTINVPKKGYCNMLIAHNPDYFDEYANWGADLVLSGHVHGGIMRLPLIGGVIAPSYIIFPKYDGGIFKEKKSVMLLGRGMGAHTIPIRIFNPAELYEVCLNTKE